MKKKRKAEFNKKLFFGEKSVMIDTILCSSEDCDKVKNAYVKQIKVPKSPVVNSGVECSRCGAKYVFVYGEGWISTDKVEVKQPAFNQFEQKQAIDSRSQDYVRSNSSNIPLTTGFSITGKNIVQEIEIVSAECVYGMNIFKDWFADVRDIFGGRSKAIQDTLRDARRTALQELKQEALLVGADAVIGVKLDYHEISGAGKKGMIMLVVSGTAVKLE